MNTLEYIILFTFVGSVGSLVGGILLLSKEQIARKLSHFFASFAAGTLLGTAFFDLLPEAHHEVEEIVANGGAEIDIFIWVLAGIVIFFLMERFIHWFHHHEEQHEHERETKTTLPLIIISDTAHNFIDGVVIAATFSVDVSLGIVTTLAIFAHELPQEIGDFGLMLHKGMKRKSIILVNLASAAAAFAGALITYAIGDMFEGLIPMLLALTAGFFIYIASSDLIPEIHYEKRKNHAFVETLLLILGIVMIHLSTTMLPHGH